MVKKVVLASPRGFCAGVVRAVDIVQMALETYEAPVYVRKEIIHNPHVVAELSSKGAIFVEELEQVPSGGRVIFSAHGVSPEVWKEARARSLEVLDATCPLVTKVHLEAVRYARQQFTIILIGHEGHDEIIGTMGEAPDRIRLVGTVEEIDRLEVEDPQKVAYLTQTTLSLQDTRELIDALRRKFPHIQSPPSKDICYATQNRQEAVASMARVSDLILVLGAVNSSNANRLVEEAERVGTPARLIGSCKDIRPQWLQGVETVGVTSGASTPERLVWEVVRFFQESGAIFEEFVLRAEDVHFPLPPVLVEDHQSRHSS